MLILWFVLSLEKPPTDQQIEGLINVMTLEEKVGQMAQLAIDLFIDVPTDSVIPEAAKKGIIDYKIGSILNTYGGVSHSKEVWTYINAEFYKYTEETDLKIPILYGLDSIHGANFVNNFTSFPQQIGMAATFNPSLLKEGSRISAYETRAASVGWVFSPVMDLGLDPRWPRIWEGFGEDPYLSSQFGIASVHGFQGKDPNLIDEFHVAACAKHYLAYSNPFTGKDRTPAILSDIFIREYHLPSFKAAVDAGVASVMVNSGLINGIPTHMNHYLLTTVLKEELGFQGVIVTDWQDIENIHTRDHLAPTQKDAVKLAINAGIDMSMIPYNYDFIDYLIELVHEGEVSIDRINDAVRRILKMKAKMNLWDLPVTKSEDYPEFGSEAHANASYTAASESITLLKNENSTLPLAKNTKVLVVGPNSNSHRSLNGGWSYSWQGNAGVQYAVQYNTIYQAIQKVNGEENTVFSQGVRYIETGNYYEDEEVNISESVALARDVDYIILALGENTYTEKPGDLSDLEISQNQIDLAKALASTGKPIILVLNQGRPRIISRIEQLVSAILWIYWPGNYGGDALADILFGDVNPSGKLPVTYPRYSASLITYWHKYAEEQVGQPGAYDYSSDYNPLWEFGYGLSYTTFNYSNLSVPSTSGMRDVIPVSVLVKNTGEVAGKEVVLLFTSDLYASLAPDVKRLRKFTKILLQPGEEQLVSFNLTSSDLSFIDAQSRRVTETGDFEIKIGGLKGKVTLT